MKAISSTIALEVLARSNTSSINTAWVANYPMYSKAVSRLLQDDLLKVGPDGATYQLTPKGQYLVNYILDLEMPTAIFSIPE